jgi:hypothetical protein
MNPLESAKAERETLLRQRAEIERKLQAVEASIKLLEPEYGEARREPSPEWMIGDSEQGLTDSIRKFLQWNREIEWSPVAIRDGLVGAGYDFGQQANPLASIHTVLKRITNGSDPRFKAVQTEKGALYKFVPGLKEKK